MAAMGLSDEGSGEWGERVWLVVVCAVVSAYVGLGLWGMRHPGVGFQDARVYLRGVRTFRAGGNPYEHFSQLNFVNSPLFLRVGSWLYGAVPLKALAVVYLGLNTLAVVAMPVVIAKEYLRCRWMTVAVALGVFFFHPLMTAEIAIFTGNISSLLYTSALVAGIWGMRRNWWVPFYVVVAVCAVVKLPFLTLLLLPILVGKRQWWGSVATVVAVGVEGLVERGVWPAEYKAFLESASFQITVLKDAGFGIFRYFYHFHVGARVPWIGDKIGYVAHFAVVGVILLGLWRMRAGRGVEGGVPERIWVAVVMVTAVLASPRMMEYDATVAVLPTVLLVVEAMEVLMDRYRAGRVPAAAIAVPVAMFAVLVNRSAFAAMFVLLLGSVVLVLGGVTPRVGGGERAV